MTVMVLHHWNDIKEQNLDFFFLWNTLKYNKLMPSTEAALQNCQAQASIIWA